MNTGIKIFAGLQAVIGILLIIFSASDIQLIPGIMMIINAINFFVLAHLISPEIKKEK